MTARHYHSTTSFPFKISPILRLSGTSFGAAVPFVHARKLSSEIRWRRLLNGDLDRDRILRNLRGPSVLAQFAVAEGGGFHHGSGKDLDLVH